MHVPWHLKELEIIAQGLMLFTPRRRNECGRMFECESRRLRRQKQRSFLERNWATAYYGSFHRCAGSTPSRQGLDMCREPPFLQSGSIAGNAVHVQTPMDRVDCVPEWSGTSRDYFTTLMLRLSGKCCHISCLRTASPHSLSHGDTARDPLALLPKLAKRSR